MEHLVIVRGGGDIATGTIYKLHKCGFKVIVLETSYPSAIRRNVAFSEAVYNGCQKVEDVTSVLAHSLEHAVHLVEEGKLPVLVDPNGDAIYELKPEVVVDGILAKRNLGTNKTMAPITIALGPGFCAGKDVDAVVETKRGHSLGKAIYQGEALANTGIPGMVGGYSKERVLHSPEKGIVRQVKKITETVKQGDVIAYIESDESTVPVCATIDGILRGMIPDGYPVTKGFKIADIDPRMDEYDNCFTISDKARCIAGGVLEAILVLRNQMENKG